MPDLPVRYLPLTKDNLLPCPHPVCCPFGTRPRGACCPLAVKDGDAVQGKDPETGEPALLQPTCCKLSR